MKVPPTRRGTLRLTRASVAVRTTHWTSEHAWDTLVEIIIDQLQVEPEQVCYSASIAEDLGCD